MTADEIFNSQDYQQLKTARTKLASAIDIIDRCRACGIDTSAKEERRQQLDQILSLYEQHFFPTHALKD